MNNILRAAFAPVVFLPKNFTAKYESREKLCHALSHEESRHKM